MRRLRNGGGLSRKWVQDVDAKPEHPLAHTPQDAPPDDQRDVRCRHRFDDRLQRLNAAGYCPRQPDERPGPTARLRALASRNRGQDRQLGAVADRRRQSVEEADVFSGEIDVDEAP